MLGKQGRADAIEAAEEQDLGALCQGAPALGVRGCGGERAPRTTGDPRLRWCCAGCAEKAALRLHLAGPRQLRMGGGELVTTREVGSHQVITDWSNEALVDWPAVRITRPRRASAARGAAPR